MMTLITPLLPLILLCAGCGPGVSDFAGTYTVTPHETIGTCEGGEALPTDLASITSIKIGAGESSDLVVSASRCNFTAGIADDPPRFVIPSQSCTISIDEPDVILKVSGEGTVSDDGSLSLTLTGTYNTDNFGRPVTCDYTLEASGS